MFRKIMFFGLSSIVFALGLISGALASDPGWPPDYYMCGAYMAQPGEVLWCDGGGCMGNNAVWGGGTCAPIACYVWEMDFVPTLVDGVWVPIPIWELVFADTAYCREREV